MNTFNYNPKRVGIAAVSALLLWLMLATICARGFKVQYLFHHFGMAWLVIFALVWLVLPSFSPKLGISSTLPGARRRVKGNGLITITAEDPGAWDVVNVTPPRVFFGMVFRGWVMAALAASIPGLCFGHVAAGWITFAVLGVFFSFLLPGLTNTQRKIEHRNFAVGPAGVRLPSGAVVPRSAIFGTIIRNTGGAQLSGGTMVMGSGAAGAIAMGMAGTFNGIAVINAGTARKVAAISYTVELEHSGISTILAAGLTDTLATQLQKDVMRRIEEYL